MQNLNTQTLAFLAGYLVFVVIRGIYDRRGPERRLDPQEVLAMACVGMGMMVTPLLFAFTPLFNDANYNPPRLAPVLGGLVMVGALMLFWRSHADLGANFSRTLELQERHVLVMRGVYARMRHPMYAAIWLFALAQAMLLPNWIAASSGLLGFAPMYFMRTPREEAMMIKAFGQEYVAYMKRSGRIWPKFA